MQRSTIWVTFFLIIAGLTGWFIIKAGNHLINYYSLRTQLPVTIDRWEIKEERANKYAIKVFFIYSFKKKSYGGVDRVGDFYPNPWAAEGALNKFKKQEWQVWIDPNRPAKGALQKIFPYKATFSAVVLVGLVVYFIYLALYMGVKNAKR